MKHRQFRSINECLAQVAGELVMQGQEANVVNANGHVAQTLELLNVSLAFAPWHNTVCTLPERKFAARNAVAEFLWYMSGDNKVDRIAKFMPNWAKFANADGLVNSNYGVYWQEQMPGIIAELLRDNGSRRAVLSIYDGKKLGQFDKDTPCTETIQFMIRDNKLHMIVNMRSNDIWYGLTIDQFCFSMLHRLAYYELSADLPALELGTYFHNAASLHAYVSDGAGKVTLTKQMLFDMCQNFIGNGDHGRALTLPPGTTFKNFWRARFEDKEFLELLPHFMPTEHD